MHIRKKSDKIKGPYKLNYLYQNTNSKKLYSYYVKCNAWFSKYVHILFFSIIVNHLFNARQ